MSAPGARGAHRRGDLAGPTLVAATVASGLSAGVFFAYASSVMLALHRADDRTFVTVMQQINDAIQNPAFFLVVFGAPVLIAAAAVQQRRRGHRAAATPLFWALALYVVGLIITSAANVPLNDQLAAAGAPGRILDIHGCATASKPPGMPGTSCAPSSTPPS